MFCNKCNNELKKDALFCSSCGEKVGIIDGVSEPQQQFIQNTFEQQQTLEPKVINNFDSNQKNYQQKENFKSSGWKSIVSLVIGIISLVFVFIFQIFTMPLSIVGIVFGAISFKNNKKYKAGLILNIISFVIAIPIFILYGVIFDSRLANPAVGTWDCKPFNNGFHEDLDYIMTFKLNDDNKFKLNIYNEEKDNYVIGTYEFVDLHKTNDNATAKYYSIILNGEEFVSDGILQTEPYKSEYEIGILKDLDQAVLMNTYTYNIYYCYKNDLSNPKIETNYSDNYNE